MQGRQSLPIFCLNKTTKAQDFEGSQIKIELTQEQHDKNSTISSPRNRLDRLKFKKLSPDQKKKDLAQGDQKQSLQAKKDIQTCLLHSAPADLICITDGQLVCAKCALFGCHKGHDINNRDGISSKITDLAEQIFPFYEELKQIENKCIGENFRKQWVQNMKDQQQSMTKQVSSVIQQAVNQLYAIQRQQNQVIKEYFGTQIKLVQQVSKMAKQQNLLKKWFKQIQGLPNIIQQIVSQCKLDNSHLKYLNNQRRGDQLFWECQSLKKMILSAHQKNQRNLSTALSLLKLRVNFQFKKYLADMFVIKKGQDKISASNQKQDQIEPKSTRSISSKDISAPLNFKLQSSPISKRFDEDCMLLSIGVQSSFPRSFQSNQFDNNLSNQQSENCLPHLEISSIKMVEQSYMDNTKSEQGRAIFTNIQNASTLQVTECYKRKKKLEIPQKYKGIVEDLKNDRADQVDLGGAQLGDTNILALCQYIRKSKRLRVLKLIRNKISDDAVGDILRACAESKVSSLNLSQNFLTDRAVTIIEQQNLQRMRNITLSLNKINRRNVKTSIQSLSRKGLTLSI